MPPGESPGERGQQGHLIVFEKGQKGPRKGLYQNGQYVGVQAHMLTRLKTRVYLLYYQYSPIYTNITLYNQIFIIVFILFPVFKIIFLISIFNKQNSKDN